MRLWPARSEHRDASATDAIVDALVSAASGGNVPPLVEALGAVEIAAGLWGRSLASATIEPSTVATRALTPSVLAAIGRGLAVRGEAVFAIEVLPQYGVDPVELIEASTWKVSGGTRPETWLYAVELPTPNGVVKRTLPAESVVHVRYATRPRSPWAGVSPLGMASETRTLAAWIERRLAEETSTATSYVLPLPDGGPGESFLALKNGLQAGKGKLHLFETVAKGWGAGEGAAPQGDYDVKRLGAAPPDGLRNLRSDLRSDVLGIYGVPSSIHGTGGSARESYRQMLGSTIAPLAALIVEELSVKLDTPGLTFTFESLKAADITGRARAFKALVDAGMDKAKAQALTGLE